MHPSPAVLPLPPCRPAGQVQAVAFDFGGVLQPKGASHLRFVADWFNVAPEAVAANMAAAQPALKRGRIDEAAFWQQLAEALGSRVPTGWQQRWQAHIAAQPLDQGVWALCRALLAAGYRLPLCANTTPWRAEANHGRGAYAPFWPRLLSCELGVAKPEPAIFAALVAQTRLPAAAMVFIDDKPANVAAAQQAGLSALVFTSCAQLQADLRPLLQR